MDNLTHTLVGAALAEAGLKKRTALGTATLMIGANFPDIDVIAVPLGDSFGWRRGITHGFLALAVLPFVLAWLMQLYDRQVRLRRNPAATPADFRQLTILAAIAILTHPTLDFMNSYGMRWLMPFVDKWFYADGLFIVDLWIIVALVAGIVWSRRRKTTRPARAALAFVAVYIVVNLGVTEAGRRGVAARFPGAQAMVAPVPLVPWNRDVLVDGPAGYLFGSYSPAAGLIMGAEPLPKGDKDPAVASARAAPEARSFVNWVRFPFYRVVREGHGTYVRIVDARYAGQGGAGRGGWASVEVRLP